MQVLPTMLMLSMQALAGLSFDMAEPVSVRLHKSPNTARRGACQIARCSLSVLFVTLFIKQAAPVISRDFPS